MRKATRAQWVKFGIVTLLSPDVPCLGEKLVGTDCPSFHI